MTAHGIQLDGPAIRAFCERWKVTRLLANGSILRDDFGPESDIDFLAEFSEEGSWSAFDEVHVCRELERIVDHKVDLADLATLRTDCNLFRRADILATAETVCAR